MTKITLIRIAEEFAIELGKWLASALLKPAYHGIARLIADITEAIADTRKRITAFFSFWERQRQNWEDMWRTWESMQQVLRVGGFLVLLCCAAVTGLPVSGKTN
jgi:hypothetical protein